MALSALSIAALAVLFIKSSASFIPGSLGVQDGGNVFSSRPSAIPASPSCCSGGSRTQLGSEWDGDACDCRKEWD